ncbi:MAG: DUF4388 domain-containing protein, partial [Proteobacteria bacterium]|nr:DUF4388 domain-containing protein [Pseudomonadota bacterium]
IEEVPLPDLLQLFSSSKKNGVLVVRTETDVGKLYLDAGQVVYATLNDDDTLGAEKSLYRIVGWTAGTFCLESQPEEEFPRQLKLSTEGLLMEAMRRMDEMARLDDELPAMDATLSLASPLVAELRDLEPQQLDVLQTALNHRVVEAILNHCPADDLSTCQALVELLKSGYLQEA